MSNFENVCLVGQVSLEVLRHAKSANLLLAEDGLHLSVRCEKLFVLRVLQLLLLEVGPDTFDDLWP